MVSDICAVISLLCRLTWAAITELIICSIYGLSWTTCAERVAHRWARANFLCIKVFQAAALSLDTATGERISRALLPFTDTAPWNDTDDLDMPALLDILRHQSFAIGDIERPLHSGTIAAVYRVIGPERQVWALKVRRRNIDTRLHSAMAPLRGLAALSPAWLAESISATLDSIAAQTDFLQEAQYMHRFADNFSHLPDIRIPTVITATSSAILMEYLEGGLTVAQLSPEHHMTFARLLIKIGLLSTFVFGLAHGDLHCGNILFFPDATPSPTIGILDFGLMLDIQPAHSERMLSILLNIKNRPTINTANDILSSDIVFTPNAEHIPPPPHIRHKMTLLIANTLQSIIDRHNNLSLDRVIDIVSQCTRLLSHPEMRRANIRLNPELVRIQSVLAMSQGVVFALSQSLPFTDLLDDVINHTFHLNLLAD